jgi:hypothetical protein
VKFKAEICVLLAAIILFAVSAFFYSYQPASQAASLTLSYPYRGYAFAALGFGSAMMAAASISYSKRSKDYVQQQL